MMLATKTPGQLFSQRNQRLFTVVTLISLVLAPVSPGCVGFAAAGADVASSAKDLLKKGDYYYSIDDTTDRAAELYKQLIARYPTSLEAEQAQITRAFSKKFIACSMPAEAKSGWPSSQKQHSAPYKV